MAGAGNVDRRPYIPTSFDRLRRNGIPLTLTLSLGGERE
jgi:hypothetical protein